MYLYRDHSSAMSGAIKFIMMDSPVKGALRRIIFCSKCCTALSALREAGEYQDRKVLRDRLYRSVCNRPFLCLPSFTVSGILLSHGLTALSPLFLPSRIFFSLCLDSTQYFGQKIGVTLSIKSCSRRGQGRFCKQIIYR